MLEADVTRMLNLDTLMEQFRPYYLNSEKVDDFFAQQFNGLKEFTLGHEDEVASEVGGSVRGSLLLPLLGAELAAQRTKGHTDTRTEKYELSTLARFLILKKAWVHKGILAPLERVSPSSRHSLVSFQGPYRFAERVKDKGIASVLRPPEAEAIREQQKYEQKGEREKHYIYFIETPVRAVSIISGRFITHVGFRYFPGESGNRDINVLFVGAIIGPQNGLLFLDPIAIGYVQATT